MIEGHGLTKIYREGGRDIRPLDGIDFSCDRGEFVLIVGRSGCGKTTLLNVLGGLTRPTSGSVRVDGNDILTLDDNIASALRSKMIGFVFQFPGLLSTLNVLENVMLPAMIGKKNTDAALRARDLLERVGIAHKAASYPGHLSGGELKRAAIARALMNNPAIIFADEPTADLDLRTEQEVMNLFHEINREGTTIVMVTHSPDLSPFATRIVRMDEGRLMQVEL
jgi:putative ABC transport system ATP-binding protein